jgi:hypothetical protein
MLVPGFQVKTALSGDPANRLPEGARARLLVLREQRQEQALVVQAIGDEIHDARLQLQREQGHLRRIKEAVTPELGVSGRRLTDEDQVVQLSQGKVERFEKELARLQQRYDAASARWATLSRLAANVDAWLAGVPAHVQITAHLGTAAKPRRGEDLPTAIARVRGERNDIIGAIEATRVAPPKASAVKARMRQQVSELAARGRPGFHGADMRWPADNTRLDLFGSAIAADGIAQRLAGFAAGETVNALAFVAWLNRDAIIHRLETEIESGHNDATALDDDERSRRLTDSADRLLSVDRDLCSLIEQKGGELPDAACDPRAVLQVEGPAG